MPTQYLLTAYDVGEREMKALDAWSKVYALHKNNPNQTNTNGMRDQFVCHVNYAFYKTPWNLEPSRLDVGYAQTVLKGCNP